MPVFMDQAIVLRRHDYSETSQIVVLLTREHGKVRAIAKGIKRSTKKRFATGMDLLDVGTAALSVKTDRPEVLATLTEWKQSTPISGLRDRLERLYAAEYAVEVTAHLTEEADPHPELFDALLTSTKTLAQTNEPFDGLRRYQQALLRSMGSLPRFDACVICHRADGLTHFSSHQGGMICGQCEPSQRETRQVSASTWNALRGTGEPGSPLGPFRLLNYHISHLMGRAPRLASKLLSTSLKPRNHDATPSRE